MKINIGDYLVTTDERQFIVSKKSIIQEGRLTKAENVGKEVYRDIAYCTTFNSALKFLPQQAIRDNDDIVVIAEKLKQIESDIKALDKKIFSISEADSNDIR